MIRCYRLRQWEPLSTVTRTCNARFAKLRDERGDCKPPKARLEEGCERGGEELHRYHVVTSGGAVVDDEVFASEAASPGAAG